MVLVAHYTLGSHRRNDCSYVYVTFLCSGSIEADDQEGNSPRISPRHLEMDSLKETYQPGMYAQLMKKHVRE